MPCRLWAQLWGEEETCTGRETGPKWLLVASASFPFFSADQFVVSVPTEVPGSFNKTKVNWGGCFLVGMVEEGTRKADSWERARPQPPDILVIMREWISPGPSQGPTKETEAQIG